MTVRGTRILTGDDARIYREIIDSLVFSASGAGYEEIVIPVLAEPDLWINRTGSEIESQMWTFRDKGDRPTCLIPEATAVVQDLYNTHWLKTRTKPVRVFYETRCFRYERPQAGRYREFTQFGIEILGPDPLSYEQEAKALLHSALDRICIPYQFNDNVQRGLSYYTRTGFEAVCHSLGAQQQIAGGGSYPEGCGWAIGVDRLLLAVQQDKLK